MAFRVLKVYSVPHRDLIVLAGVTEGIEPLPGGTIDLPTEIRGPGWVPIYDVQEIDFAGQLRTAVVLEWRVVEPAPFMEFADLEGRPLDCRRP
jgi:hypothetical protein